MEDITVIGASAGPGRLLFEQLRDEGIPVQGIARSTRGVATGNGARFTTLDASDTSALLDCLTPGSILFHCSRPEFLTALLARKPEIRRLVVLGSTRVYTRFPDDKCSRLAAMAHAIWMGDIPATLLHPTMIYGAPGLNNIERVVRYARLSPVIPLPGGGRSLIQPVHASDVVTAMRQALSTEASIGRAIIVPGRKAVSYREFIELIIRLANVSCRVVSMPYPLVSLGALISGLIPGLPDVTAEEVQRLLEDKAFEWQDLKDLLNIEPMDLETGLGLVFNQAPG